MSAVSDSNLAQNGESTSSREEILAQIREFVINLGISNSPSLVNHATDTVHEDFRLEGQERPASTVSTSHGSVSPASSNRSAHERMHMTIPPFNFGAVLPGQIYRSGYPKPENYDFIKNLKIKSILTLVPEPIPEEYQTFIDEAGIEHFRVHIHANKGEVRVETSQMDRALRLMLEPSHYPMLIHCNKGKHRTGCTVACFRRILRFDMDTIREEYHTYAGRKARFMDELFYETYDINPLVCWAEGCGWPPRYAEDESLSPRLSLQMSLFMAEHMALPPSPVLTPELASLTINDDAPPLLLSALSHCAPRTSPAVNEAEVSERSEAASSGSKASK